jgi:fucose permease
MDWSAIYVRGYLGAPEALAAVAPTVFVGFVCIGRFGGNAAVSRYGWTATLGACGALAGVGVVVVGTAPDTALALLGLGLLGAGLSCLVPLATAAAAVAAGDRSAEAVGLVSMVACVPSLVGPPLVGFTAVGAGLRMVFLGLLLPLAIVVAVACLASGGVAIARDTLTSRRPEADSETLVSRDGPGWTRARPSGG